MKFRKSALRGALFAVLAMSTAGAHAALYPDLPIAIKSGTGALIGDMLYIGLGSGGNKFFALNLNDKNARWQEIAPFPGGDRIQPVSAAVDGKLYVFGGLQKNENGELRLINDAYRYDPAQNSWEKLATRSPRGLVGAGAVAANGKIYLFGGSNTVVFEGYIEDFISNEKDRHAQKAVAEAYFNQRPQDYFLTPELFSYEPAGNKWYNEGVFPFQPRSSATFDTDGKNLLVVSGEIKPGLRTAASEIGRFTAHGVQWRRLGDLPAPAKGQVQDGLAGAMGGYSNGRYLLAGGANFPGTTKQFKAGKLYAHEGIAKTWHKEIYALNGRGGWRVVGELPFGIGYGVSVSYNNKVLLIGGETEGGKAVAGVQAVSYDGKKVTIE